MTISEYMTYKPPPGFRDELLEGELLLSPSPNKKHADLCHQIWMLLEECVPEEYVIRLDHTMCLDEEEEKGNRPRPDVFVMDEERWEQSDEHGGYPFGAPQLAVEVLSPSTEKTDRETKTPKYLASGSLAVWLVDGDNKRVTVYRPGERPRELTVGDCVQLPPELGGGAIPVSRIFAKPRISTVSS